MKGGKKVSKLLNMLFQDAIQIRVHLPRQLELDLIEFSSKSSLTGLLRFLRFLLPIPSHMLYTR